MWLATGLPHDALMITAANIDAISIRPIHAGRQSAECRRLLVLADMCRVLLSRHETGRSPAGADPFGAPLREQQAGRWHCPMVAPIRLRHRAQAASSKLVLGAWYASIGRLSGRTQAGLYSVLAPPFSDSILFGLDCIGSFQTPDACWPSGADCRLFVWRYRRNALNYDSSVRDGS